MSSEANTEVGVIGVCLNSLISSIVFFMLKVYGNGERCCILSVRNFDKL